ncbi:MAG: Unknown protein [uncultured Sulfurovum sp.]|uniref:Uncharacterized protein n=1 Tax=uncultured Sulfurovum sp. TaxID=269237 RepID=A0A6S6SEM4_9BACT|nr:MAG: Unknown protein [uncultured Sulfurovum sp.]
MTWQLKLGNCKFVEIEHILRRYEQAIKAFLDEPTGAILEI